MKGPKKCKVDFEHDDSGDDDADSEFGEDQENEESHVADDLNDELKEINRRFKKYLKSLERN